MTAVPMGSSPEITGLDVLELDAGRRAQARACIAALEIVQAEVEGARLLLGQWGPPGHDALALAEQLSGPLPEGLAETFEGLQMLRTEEAGLEEQTAERQRRSASLTSQLLELERECTEALGRAERQRTELAALVVAASRVMAAKRDLDDAKARREKQRSSGLGGLWQAVSGRTSALQRELDRCHLLVTEAQSKYQAQANEMPDAPRPEDLQRRRNEVAAAALQAAQTFQARRQELLDLNAEEERTLCIRREQVQEQAFTLKQRWMSYHTRHGFPQEPAVWAAVWARREEGTKLWARALQAREATAHQMQLLADLWAGWPPSCQTVQAVQAVIEVSETRERTLRIQMERMAHEALAVEQRRSRLRLDLLDHLGARCKLLQTHAPCLSAEEGAVPDLTGNAVELPDSPAAAGNRENTPPPQNLPLLPTASPDAALHTKPISPAADEMAAAHSGNQRTEGQASSRFKVQPQVGAAKMRLSEVVGEEEPGLVSLLSGEIREPTPALTTDLSSAALAAQAARIQMDEAVPGKGDERAGPSQGGTPEATCLPVAAPTPGLTPSLNSEELVRAQRLLHQHSAAAAQEAMCLEGLQDWAGEDLDGLKLGELVSRPLPEVLDAALEEWSDLQIRWAAQPGARRQEMEQAVHAEKERAAARLSPLRELQLAGREQIIAEHELALSDDQDSVRGQRSRHRLQRRLEAAQDAYQARGRALGMTPVPPPREIEPLIRCEERLFRDRLQPLESEWHRIVATMGKETAEGRRSGQATEARRRRHAKTWAALHQSLGVPQRPERWAALWANRVRGQTLWAQWQRARLSRQQHEAEMAALWSLWPPEARNIDQLRKVVGHAGTAGRPSAERTPPGTTPASAHKTPWGQPRRPHPRSSGYVEPGRHLPLTPSVPALPLPSPAIPLSPEEKKPGPTRPAPQREKAAPPALPVPGPVMPLSVPTRPPAVPLPSAVSPGLPQARPVPPLPASAQPVSAPLPDLPPRLVPVATVLQPAITLPTVLPGAPPSPAPSLTPPLPAPGRLLPTMPLPDRRPRGETLWPPHHGGSPARISQREKAVRVAARISEDYSWHRGFVLLADTLDRSNWGQLRERIEEEIARGMTPEEFELVLQLRAYWHDQTHFQSPYTSRYDSMPWGLALELIRRCSGIPCLEEMTILIERCHEHTRQPRYAHLYAFSQRLGVLLDAADPGIDLDYWLCTQEGR